MIEWLHPGLLLIGGAALVPLLKGRLLQAYLPCLAIAALLDCILMVPGTYGTARFLDYTLTFGRVDRLSLVFAYVFTLAGAISFIYALHVKDRLQHVAALIYMGSALGVTFAGDYFVLFIFWELMAFSSVFLVWANRTPESISAGFRYLLVHVFGGLCLLGGIMLHIGQTGSISFDAMHAFAGSAAFTLILFGFILNAAVPPLNAWLPDAYPSATVTGAVFMSAYTTKSAVYVLVRGFAGTEALMWLGAVMAVYGVIYATMENNGRRLLAYHIISQVGFMVCGIGIGTEMAVNGATAHAFAHIIYKGLLFMGAGAVLYMAGTVKLSELGGLYKTMPLTMIFFLVGGLSIAGAPLMSGFVSKSMTISGAGEQHNAFAFLMLTLASSGTFLSIVLKMTYYMFFGKDCGRQVTDPPKNMLVAMGIASFICIFIGIFPKSLYALLPYPAEYAPYTAQHVLDSLGLFFFTTLGFILFMKKLDPKPGLNLDTDWFYRKAAQGFMRVVRKPIASFEYRVVGEAYEYIIRSAILLVSRVVNHFETEAVQPSPQSLAAQTGRMGGALQRLQTGKVHDYALVMVAGMVALALSYVFWWAK
ncbi:MAG TPA: Na(+)/H(+) antiporter subunit D [Dissulfurispiraceae bacterium]|nr:Na(+)/H(+) antiporter subunit D [Dissulfurispiraceae bacterium]